METEKVGLHRIHYILLRGKSQTCFYKLGKGAKKTGNTQKALNNWSYWEVTLVPFVLLVSRCLENTPKWNTCRFLGSKLENLSLRPLWAPVWVPGHCRHCPGAVCALPKGWDGAGGWKEHPKGELGVLGSTGCGRGCWALLGVQRRGRRTFPNLPC